MDDNDDLRSLLGQVLALFGWNVETAANGREAVTSLENHVPDVILLDLSMPEIDGWGFLERRQGEPTWMSVPVLVMSANHAQEEDAIELGANAFLGKPFTLERLRSTLAELLAL